MDFLRIEFFQCNEYFKLHLMMKKSKFWWIFWKIEKYWPDGNVNTPLTVQSINFDCTNLLLSSFKFYIWSTIKNKTWSALYVRFSFYHQLDDNSGLPVGASRWKKMTRNYGQFNGERKYIENKSKLGQFSTTELGQLFLQ